MIVTGDDPAFCPECMMDRLPKGACKNVRTEDPGTTGDEETSTKSGEEGSAESSSAAASFEQAGREAGTSFGMQLPKVPRRELNFDLDQFNLDPEEVERCWRAEEDPT